MSCSVAEGDATIPFHGEVMMLSFNTVTIHTAQLDLDSLPRPETLLVMEVVTPDGYYASKGTYVGSSRPGEVRVQITQPPAKIERRGLLRVDCEIPLTWRSLGGPETAPLPANAVIACAEILPRLRIDGHPELVSLLNAMAQRLDMLEQELETLREDQDQAAAAIPDVIINLSGGGLLFRTRRRVAPGDRIEATFKLDDDGDVFVVDINVQRLVESRDSQGRFGVGGEFCGLNVGTRDHLVNWVMEQNRRAVRGRVTR